MIIDIVPLLIGKHFRSHRIKNHTIKRKQSRCRRRVNAVSFRFHLFEYFVKHFIRTAIDALELIRIQGKQLSRQLVGFLLEAGSR